MVNGRAEFLTALELFSADFGVPLAGRTAGRLADYFELVMRWTLRLHLVAPCTPAHFALRHVLESLLALEHLPPGARLADVGAGAGLPSLPCLIAREDLSAVLVEASTKKVIFLLETAGHLGLRGRVEVVNERFEETRAPAVDAVACRAIERFTDILPRLLAWAPPAAGLLLFGGDSLREAMERAGRDFTPRLVPESERRYLFVVSPRGQTTNAGR